MASTDDNNLTSLISKLNDHEFVVMLNGTDLMKYNTVKCDWTTVHRFTDRVEHSLVAFDDNTNRLFIHSEESMKVLNALNGSIIHNHEFNQREIELSLELSDHVLVNVNGVIHRMGGYDPYIHTTWNDEKEHWTKLAESENMGLPLDTDYRCWHLYAVSLVYVKSKNMILLLGATAFDVNGNRRDTCVWRFKIAASKWERVKGATLTIPNLANCQAMLTTNEENVIIVDRSKWSERSGVRILNISDDDNYTLGPRKVLHKAWVDPHAVVMKRRETQAAFVISLWFRKSFGFVDQDQASCPVVIIALMMKFASEDMLHLISGRGRFRHYVIPVADILSSNPNSAELPESDELPGYLW